MNTHLIARFVEGFFHDYLVGQRGLSRNTIVSYRDALKLFLRFARERLGKPVDKLTVEDVDSKQVTAFLEHLEVSEATAPKPATTGWPLCIVSSAMWANKSRCSWAGLSASAPFP